MSWERGRVATLRTIAASRPLTRAALLDLHGIGPVKAERHGDAVLDIVSQHTPATATA